MTGGAVRFCTKCGRPVAEGIRFCTSCGNRLAQPEPAGSGAAGTGQQLPPANVPPVAGMAPDTTIAPSAGLPPLPPSPAPRAAPEPVAPAETVHARPVRGPGRGRAWLALLAGCTVLLAGAATAGGIALAHRHATAPRPAQSGGTAAHSSSGQATGSGHSPAPAPTTSSPTPSASPTQPLASDTVAVSAAAASNPQHATVVSFLETYFTAINSRDYSTYLSLLGPQAQATYSRRDFMHGYRSTSDSAEKLKRIYALGGQTVAVLGFTSHQNPRDSINGQESCTRWRIALYLQPTGAGYTIGAAPPGYHPAYAPCP
jgi:hypothetical protein